MPLSLGMLMHWKTGLRVLDIATHRNAIGKRQLLLDVSNVQGG